MLHAVRFDDVADLDVVVARHLDAALEAFAHLAGIVLESLQRIKSGRAVRRRINDDAVSDYADLRVPLDVPGRDVAARDGARLADLERLADHGPAQVNDLLARLQ